MNIVNSGWKIPKSDTWKFPLRKSIIMLDRDQGYVLDMDSITTKILYLGFYLIGYCEGRSRGWGDLGIRLQYGTVAGALTNIKSFTSNPYIEGGAGVFGIKCWIWHI